MNWLRRLFRLPDDSCVNKQPEAKPLELPPPELVIHTGALRWTVAESHALAATLMLPPMVKALQFAEARILARANSLLRVGKNVDFANGWAVGALEQLDYLAALANKRRGELGREPDEEPLQQQGAAMGKEQGSRGRQGYGMLQEQEDE